MKVSNALALLLGSSLLFSAAAVAGNTNNKKTLQLTDSVTVAGKQLKPGTYTLRWDGSGPDVQLNIFKGNKTVATAPAHIVSIAASNQQDGYSALAEKDGTSSVQQFFFRGEKFDLDLSQAAGANSTPAATSSPTN